MGSLRQPMFSPELLTVYPEKAMVGQQGHVPDCESIGPELSAQFTRELESVSWRSGHHVRFHLDIQIFRLSHPSFKLARHWWVSGARNVKANLTLISFCGPHTISKGSTQISSMCCSHHVARAVVCSFPLVSQNDSN